MDCKTFFAGLLAKRPRDFAKLIENDFSNGACEAHSISPHSSGPVGDPEIVYRQIFAPMHIDPETKEVVPLAFDDASSIGLSVNRTLHISFRGVCALGEDKANLDRTKGKTDRVFLGVIEAPVSDVRGILQEKVRGFFVYDTATQTVPSHADICQKSGGTRDVRAGARVDLCKSFSKRPLRNSLFRAIKDATLAILGKARKKLGI
ncbi:MAG: hypothetical protein HY067_20745 [Betaproteobacteria bacterium]|nr:hypothetical protein [Betaproteobacteria bacterium]